MPELPEVEVTRRGLAPQLTGRTISGVAVREPRLRWPVPRDVLALAGRTVRTIRRRGKYLLVDCGDGHLILHLGMSGSLRVLPPGTPAQKHDHFDLVLVDWSGRQAGWADALRGRTGSRVILFGRHTDLEAHADARAEA